MKCSIMLFIRFYTVFKGEKISSDKRIQYFLNYNLTPLTIQSLLYQTKRKNQLVYKALKACLIFDVSSKMILFSNLGHIL